MSYLAHPCVVVWRKTSCCMAAKIDNTTYIFTYGTTTDNQVGYLSAFKSIDVQYTNCFASDHELQSKTNNANNVNAAVLGTGTYLARKCINLNNKK